MAGVSGYTTKYNFPLFDKGAGGEDSADNGLKEWLDAEMFLARNIITKNGDIVTKNGDILYKST